MSSGANAKKVVFCPRCRLQNAGAATHCLGCKMALPREPEPPPPPPPPRVRDPNEKLEVAPSPRIERSRSRGYQSFTEAAPPEEGQRDPVTGKLAAPGATAGAATNPALQVPRVSATPGAASNPALAVPRVPSNAAGAATSPGLAVPRVPQQPAPPPPAPAQPQTSPPPQQPQQQPMQQGYPGYPQGYPMYGGGGMMMPGMAPGMYMSPGMYMPMPGMMMPGMYPGMVPGMMPMPGQQQQGQQGPPGANDTQPPGAITAEAGPIARLPESPTPPPSMGNAKTQRFSQADVMAEAAATGPAPAPPPSAAGPLVAFDDPRVAFWLFCNPLPPIPVGLKPMVTLGRSVEADLVLPHSSVSRTHAVILKVGPHYHLEDRSSYGTYVNGERATGVDVKDGDSITIGPYEILVRARSHVADAPNSDSEESETRPLATALRDLPSADAMTGRIEKQPLAEVLQALEFNQKSGTLELFSGESGGRLVVYNGQPMFATYGGLTGEDAVFAMLSQKQGYYAFRTKIEPGERTLKKSITAILLDASRRIDENE